MEPPQPAPAPSPPPAQPPSGGYVAMSSTTARPRGGRTACGPCSRRKIRCDAFERNGEPCSNCVKRGQPDGCTFNDDAPRSGTRRSRASDGARSPSAPRPKKPRPSETAQSVLDGIHAASTSYAPAPPSNGSHAQTPSWGSAVNAPQTASFGSKSYNVVPGPQQQQQQGWQHLATQPPPPQQAVYYAPPEQPFQVYPAPFDMRELLPSHKTALRYFEVYKTICHPLYPVIPDLEEFEAHVCQYVEDMSRDRLLHDLAASTGRVRAARLAWLSLLTATVATGAQYSDLPINERDDFVTAHGMLYFPFRIDNG